MNDSNSEILQTQGLGLNGTHEKRDRDLALAKELISRPVAGNILAARSQFRVDFRNSWLIAPNAHPKSGSHTTGRGESDSVQASQNSSNAVSKRV